MKQGPVLVGPQPGDMLRISSPGHVFEAPITAVRFEYTNEAQPNDLLITGGDFSAEGTIACRPDALGTIARAMHRAGRNRRKAVRRARK